MEADGATNEILTFLHEHLSNPLQRIFHDEGKNTQHEDVGLTN